MTTAAHLLELNAAEITLFGRLFAQVVDANGTTASGASVSNLFLTSKLPRPTLAAIWNIASQGKAGKLDRDGFFVGCRLVAIAQQNLPISQESLISYREVPLPMFYGPAQQYYPRDAPKTEGQPALPIQNLSLSMATPPQQHPSSTAPVARTTSPSATPQPQPTSTYIAPTKSPSPPPPNDSGTPSSSESIRSLGPSTPPDGLWEISPDKRATYLKYFDQADADKDGFVNGKEAKAFFTMSKLSSAVLREIWLLSDIDQDNRLNREEFTIAMHLTMAVRMAGVAVPPQLPDELMQYYARQMGQIRAQQPHPQRPQPQQPQPQSQQTIPSLQQEPQQPPNRQPVQQPQQPLQQPQQLYQQDHQERIQAPFSGASAGSSKAETTMASNSTQTLASSFPSKQVKPSPDQLEEHTEVLRQASSVKAQIEEQKIAIQGYQSRLPDYEEEIETLKAEARKAEETLSSMVVERKQHQASFEKVRSEVASAKIDVEKIQKLIAVEIDSLKRFESDVARSLRELDDLRLERDRGQKQVDDLKQQVQDKELAIVCLEQEMEDTRKQIGHLTEVSSYQMQIYGKVSKEYDSKNLHLSELRTAHRNLAQAATPVGDPLSAPSTTPPKLEPISAPVSNVAPDQEFVFPELTDSDFAVAGGASTRTSLKSAAAELEHLPSSLDPFPAAFQFPEDSTPQQQDPFPPSTEASSDFNWSADRNPSVTDDFSAKKYDLNPFEEPEGTWDMSLSKPTPDGVPVDASKQGVAPTGDDAKAASIDWPIEQFSPATATTNQEWAQF